MGIARQEYWELLGKSTGVGCHCLLHLTLWLILKGYKILAFASDRDRPSALAMNSFMTRACVLHYPITLDSFTVPVSMLAWSIACAFLQGTRKQGPLGSADVENRFLSVHLPRSFLVNVVALLLAYYPLWSTTLWVKPSVLPICVAFCAPVYLCPQVLSPCSRKRPKRHLSLQESQETVIGLGLIQCCEEGAHGYRVSSDTKNGTWGHKGNVASLHVFPSV